MKRLKLSQYVRSTGFIIGFVFVLFGGFGVQKSLAYSLVLSQESYDSTYPHDVGYGMGNECVGALWEEGQTITPANSFYLSQVRIKLSKTSGLDAGGVLRMGVYASDGTTLIASSTNYVLHNDVSAVYPDDFSLVTFTFDGIYLMQGVEYLLGITVVEPSVGAYVLAYASGGYGSGKALSRHATLYCVNPEDGGTNDWYFKIYGSPLPSVGLLHPVYDLTYGNPVKISGGIINATSFDIYWGLTSGSKTNHAFSGLSANGLNTDFTLDHAVYMTEGIRWLNVFMEGEAGTSTEFVRLQVNGTESTFGTSTVPIELKPVSDTESFASSTAHGFFDGLGDVMDNSCNFDFFTVFTVSTWKVCAVGVFDFMTNWIAENFVNMVDVALSKWPWGYGYRVLKILSAPFVEQPMPDLEFTMPADMGLPASAVGRSFEFNPIESYASAKGTITEANQEVWDTVLYWWNFFCYLTFAFYLVHKTKSFVP